MTPAAGRSTPYHSALTSPLVHVPSVQRASCADGIAFAHDLFTGLPPEMAGLQLLYAEPPWPNGFARFEARAGVVEGRRYKDLMLVVASIIEERTQPVICTVGKTIRKHLPPPNSVRAIKLYGGDAELAAWGCESPVGATTVEVLDDLAARYASVGDFCCGYGNTARAFRAAGKRWVVSDYNAECIGYIANDFGMTVEA